MTDFVKELRKSAAEFSPPVRSLMDIDFYKLTMGQVIFQRYSGTNVKFELIVRDKDIPVADIIPMNVLRMSLDYAMGLRYRHTDLYYLRGIDLYDRYMFKEDYLGFLRGFSLTPYELLHRPGEIKLSFAGPWEYVSMWETIALAIISELYYRYLLSHEPDYVLEAIYSRAKSRIFGKLEILERYHNLIRFADFSQRRRHSFLWQKWVVGLCKSVMGNCFTGTSNTWMAFHHDLPPIGTNAHELPMVLTALARTREEKLQAQYQVLKDWEETYGQGLRIMLPDTFGSEQFFAHAPPSVASWRGFRQDSGDPISRGELYIDWLKRNNVNPMEKLIIFSDGLDVDEILRLHEHFHRKINVAFGWGTLLGNDFRDCQIGNANLRPFSMVCKVTEANGEPCVKLSDNVLKATGPKNEIAKYVELFGSTNRTAQEVLV